MKEEDKVRQAEKAKKLEMELKKRQQKREEIQEGKKNVAIVVQEVVEVESFGLLARNLWSEISESGGRIGSVFVRVTNIFHPPSPSLVFPPSPTELLAWNL